MTERSRHTGIDIVGEAPWGTHFCLFYETQQDLIDTLVPYFKEGLENNEFCMWVTSEPLEVEDAKNSLQRVVRNLGDYLDKGQIEILDYAKWYTKSGANSGKNGGLGLHYWWIWIRWGCSESVVCFWFLVSG